MFIWHWFLLVTGTKINPATGSSWYNFFSGFGSIILAPLPTAIGVWLGIWLHTRCHVKGCLRKGKHDFKHFKLCHKHHPEVPGSVTHLHIAQLHKAGQSKQK